MDGLIVKGPSLLGTFLWKWADYSRPVLHGQLNHFQTTDDVYGLFIRSKLTRKLSRDMGRLLDGQSLPGRLSDDVGRLFVV